ncbi:MAG: hypothetical protein K9G30_05140 [Parvibaculum sp.]|nr:hypothetical protein [Parvibaculum sp.]
MTLIAKSKRRSFADMAGFFVTVFALISILPSTHVIRNVLMARLGAR